jgi:hypothetical protein
MLVYEEANADRLHLAKAVPTRWILSGKTVGIEDAPTRWGRTGFSLRLASDTHIEGEVRLPERQPRETLLRLRLPAGKKIRQLQTKGGPASIVGDAILFPAGSGAIRSFRATIG